MNHRNNSNEMHRGHNYKGIFISFEGIDFCGKSTQIELLDTYLAEKRIKHIVRREPGGTDAGELVRKVLLHEEVSITPEMEAYLFAASRSQIVREILMPNLPKGICTIIDRYVDSSRAYQGTGGRLGVTKVDEINRVAINGIMPDITFLVDIPIDEMILRKKKAKPEFDRIESSDREFYERVRDGYLWLANKEPERIKVIDGMKSVNEMHKEILTYLEKYLANK